jgi:hypothetical protein
MDLTQAREQFCCTRMEVNLEFLAISAYLVECSLLGRQFCCGCRDLIYYKSFDSVAIEEPTNFHCAMLSQKPVADPTSILQMAVSLMTDPSSWQLQAIT